MRSCSRWAASSLVMSICAITGLLPLPASMVFNASVRLAATPTVHPSRSSWMATRRPMPELAPKTIAFLPIANVRFLRKEHSQCCKGCTLLSCCSFPAFSKVCRRSTGRRHHRSRGQYTCARSCPGRRQRTRWWSCHRAGMP